MGNSSKNLRFSRIEGMEMMMAEVECVQAIGFDAGAQGDRLSDQSLGDTKLPALEADPASLLNLAHQVIRAILYTRALIEPPRAC
jgi:hypothetical protein